MAQIQQRLKTLLDEPILQIPLALLFLMPLLVTLGQFWQSGFLGTTAALPIWGWPGRPWWRLQLPGWLVIALVALLYGGGIVILLRRRALGRVAAWGVAIMIGGVLTESLFSRLTGWHDLQTLSPGDLSSHMNQVILALWHNPIWEEAVFRGIPLAILLLATRGRKPGPAWARWLYVLLPAALFAWYHVPNHGPARLADTFLIGGALAYLGLRYGFAAPLVLHALFDALSIPTRLTKLAVAPNAIWMVENRWAINTTISILQLSIVALIPILLIWRWRHPERIE